MKKTFLITLLAIVYCLFLSGKAFSQISGIKTIPGDYATIAAAITALNGNGVGPGGATFNIAAGYTETITATLSLMVSGTVANPLIFQKSGTGANPKITAYTGGTATPSSAIQDGIWQFVGSDYVTIDGIDLYDPNTTNPATMEYGYGFFKASTTNGCQHNTIKNCVISLSRNNNEYGNSFALSGSRAINFINANPNSQSTDITVSSAAGTNSYNVIYGNTLQNCNVGIIIYGFNTSNSSLGDNGNDIGGTSSATGNTIVNYGGGTSGNYTEAIYDYYQWGINISNNTINNNDGSGVNHPTDIFGINDEKSTNSTITYNSISLQGGGIGGYIYCINSSTPFSTSGTTNITNNTLSGSYMTATTGNFYAIYCRYSTSPSATVTTNINFNNISGISSTGTGKIYCIYNEASSTITFNCLNNNIDSITKAGNAPIYGFYLSGIATANVKNNIVNKLSSTSVSVLSAIYGYYSASSCVIENVNSNIFSNFSGYSSIYGIYLNSAYASGANKYLKKNQIHSFSTTGGGSLYGIYFQNGYTDSISGNTIYNFNAAGGNSAVAYGIYLASLSTSSNNYIFGNKIYDLTDINTGGIVRGIYLASGNSNQVYNNIIGRLYTPNANVANSISGIYISAGTSSAFWNTVYLNATSTGALFGSSAIYASTAQTLYLINNIFVNTSTPNGAGLTVAYQRSNSTISTYSTLSNNNFYYTGTPSSNNLIYYDGTLSAQTLYLFKTFVAPCDSASKTSATGPDFLSTNGSDQTYLHIDGSSLSNIESGGRTITGFPRDFDGDIRAGNAGFPAQPNGGGIAPDIGADEYDGIMQCTIVNPGNTVSNIYNNSTCPGNSTTLSIQNINFGLGITYQWKSSSDGVLYSDINGANQPSYTFNSYFSQYYKCLVSCQYGAFAESTPLLITTPAILSTTNGAHCGAGPVSLGAIGSAGTQVKWFATPSGGSVINTGPTYTTPVLSNTTSYYVESRYPGSFYSVSSNNPYYYSSDVYGLYFTLTDTITLNSLEIVSRGGTAITIGLYNGSNSTQLLTTGSLTVPAYATSTINLGWNILPGTYRIIGTGLNGYFGVADYYYSYYPINLGSFGQINGTVYSVTNYTYSTSSNYFYFFNWNITSTCNSPRVPVVATIGTNLPLTITANQTVCSNSVATITVNSNLSNYNSYQWTPATDLYTDLACTIPYVSGNSASTVYSKISTSGSYNYTCNSTNSTYNCSNSTSTTLTVVPASVTITSGPPVSCQNYSQFFSASPSTGYGTATFQWQNSGDNVIFNDIPGANSINYTTPTSISTPFYQLLVKVGGNACVVSNVDTAVVSPQVVSTIPGSRCGLGSVTLQATGSYGATLRWFNSSTGGNSPDSGSLFTTPTIYNSTTYYVGAEYAGIFRGGRTAPTGTSSITSSSYGLVFNATTNFLLESVDVYPTSSGTLIIELQNSSGSVLQQPSFYVTGSSGTIPQTLLLNFNITAGTGYRLIAYSSPNMVRESGLGGFPYSLGPYGSITSGYSGGTTTTYYYFYNWKIPDLCQSSRVPVIATIGPSPALNITTNQTVCNNSVATIAVNSNLSNYDSYVWTPATNLFTDMACTTPYISENSSSTLYIKTTTPGSYTYTCNSANSSTNCANITSTTVTVIPAAVSITSGPIVSCSNFSQSLSAFPGTGYGAATFQWQSSSDNLIFNDIPGANSINYSTPSNVSASYYKLFVKLGGNACVESNVVTVKVPPQVISSLSGFRCGTGSVTLGASGSIGSTLHWYNSSTGGNSLYTGSVFNTPSINSTTTYYVGAGIGGSTSFGRLAPIGTSTIAASNYGLVFDAFNNFLLESVEVYATAAGNVTVQLQNSSGAILQTATIPVVAGSVSTPQTLLLNFNITTGTGLRLMAVSSPTMVRESSIGGFPYSLGSNGSIKSGYIGGISTTYYYFYNWKISDLCESARVPVVATINQSATINAIGTSPVCFGQSGNLNVGSSNVNYTYKWFPGNLKGSHQTISPVNSTAFVVLASDSITGCANSDTVQVVVIPSPNEISVTPSLFNTDSITQLVASDISGVPNYDNFIFGTDTSTSSVTGNTPYSSYYESSHEQYLLQASELTAKVVGAGNINSLAFQVTANGTGTYPQINFTIKMVHTANSDITGAYGIPISSWITVYNTSSEPAPPVGWKTYTFNTPFVWDGISNILIDICHENDLGNNCDSCFSTNSTVAYTATSFNSCYGGYVNNASACNGVATTYNLGSANYTHRPNIKINATAGAPITWSPLAGLYINAGGTVPYTGAITNTVWANPTTSIIYTATATSGFGCTSIATSTFESVDKTLNAKLYLEGIYESSGVMRQAQGLSGPEFGPGIADKITVELHDAITPYNMALEYSPVDLLTDGTLSITSIPGSLTGSYYIVIKHRNSIETWSASAISLFGNGPFYYDFTSAATQAYGDNLKLMGSYWVIYAGDATNDGVVDGSDLAVIDNSSAMVLFGYNPEDVNGDGVVDGSDMAIVDNNSLFVAHIIKP